MTMKSDALLINTSRGGIINEVDLYNVIKSGHLGGAAIDVFEQEPYNGKLKQFYPDIFFMTPHVASTCSDFLVGCRNDLDKLIKEFM